MCRCNGVNSILYESHKALTLDVSFVVLLMYNNWVDGNFFKYCGFVRQRILEAEIMQLIFHSEEIVSRKVPVFYEDTLPKVRNHNKVYVINHLNFCNY